MARTKATDSPIFLKADSKFWQAEGLQVSQRTESFKASVKGSDEQFPLTAVFNQVSFPDIQVATNAFGSTAALLKELADAVNDALMIQAKNKVKNDSLGFEAKVAEQTNIAIAAFTQQRGTSPNDGQKNKIKARVRARLEELARLEKETAADIADV